eukprot:200695_1
MGNTKLFLLLNIIAINANMDIGCNYVNMNGIGMPTDYCMQFPMSNTSFGSMVFQCNDTSTGVVLHDFTSTDCNGEPASSMDFTSYVIGFDCNRAYDSVPCPEVSILEYPGDICSGNDYSEARLIVDECFPADNTSSMYYMISCTTDSATLSWYDSPDCNDAYFINQTVLREGGMDGVEAGCIDVDGCYEDGSFIPRTDIGCNYVNVGEGIPLPIDHCMQVDLDGHIIYTKFMCNDAWNAIILQAHVNSECTDKPLYSEDFTANVLGFECHEQYEYKECNEVSVKAYAADECTGDQFSNLRIITDACVPVFNNESLTSFSEITCTEHTITYSAYDIPIHDYGNCDDIYLINRTNLTEGALDGEFAKCIDVEGCGDYTHDIVDIGCNYVNLDGFGMPMDTCWISKNSESHVSWMVYCNETWDGIVYGKWEYNKDCHGTPLHTIELQTAFPFVCDETYQDIECDTTTLTAYADKKCSGMVYNELSFITDVCLYSDVDDYVKVTCEGEDAMLSIYETVDGTCNDDTLINRKILTSFEFMDEVFECVDLEDCHTSTPTGKPNVQTTVKPNVLTTVKQNVQTTVKQTVLSTTNSAHLKKKDGKENKNSNTLIMVGIVSGIGSCILLLGVFCVVRYLKQKQEVKNLDVTHTGQLVMNPYGQIDK